MLRPPLFFAGLLALAIVAGTLVPPAAPAAPVPKHLLPKEDPFCFATRVGDRLESVLGGQQTIVCVVTKVEKTTEGLQVRLEHEGTDGARTHVETVIVSELGVKVIEWTGAKLDPPFWWFKLPHVADNTWPDALCGQRWTGKTVGWEEIEVPAGKFRAIHVQHIYPHPGNTTSYWFAPGRGCIKWESNTSKCELTAFKPGK